MRFQMGFVVHSLEISHLVEAIDAFMKKIETAVRADLINDMNVYYSIKATHASPENPPEDYECPPTIQTVPQYCGTTYARLGRHVESGVSQNALVWSLRALLWDAAAYAAKNSIQLSEGTELEYQFIVSE